MRVRANNKDAFRENDTNDYDDLFLMMIAHEVLLAQHTTLPRYVLHLQITWWS